LSKYPFRHFFAGLHLFLNRRFLFRSHWACQLREVGEAKEALIMIRSIALALFVAASVSQAVVITHHVDAHDNLYNTAWVGATNPYASAIATPGALDARVVEYGGGAFNFATGGLITLAVGCAVDAGASCTDADGLAGDFRGLPVYSLIGIWSASATAIDPLGAAFFVGSANSFVTPVSSTAYLFLAENDGVFADNGGPGYDVTINFTSDAPAAVPEPGTWALMGLGLVGMGFRFRKARC
jgi:PEP-CTERM motif